MAACSLKQLLNSHRCDMIQTLRSLIFHPRTFFKELDEPLSPSVKLTAALIAIAFFPQVLSNYISMVLVNNFTLFLFGTSQSPSLLGAFFSTLVSYLFFVMSFVIGIPLFHWYLKLFDAKGTMTQTAQLTLYGMVPILLVQWVPILGVFLGLAASVYAVIIQIFGCIELHKMTKKQLMWAFLWVPLIVMGAFTLLFVLFLLWLVPKIAML